MTEHGSERLSNIRDLHHLLMDLLQGIDPLLQLDIFSGKLSLAMTETSDSSSYKHDIARSGKCSRSIYLVVSLSKLLLDILLSSSGEGSERCSAKLKSVLYLRG